MDGISKVLKVDRIIYILMFLLNMLYIRLLFEPNISILRKIIILILLGAHNFSVSVAEYIRISLEQESVESACVYMS